MAEARLNTYYKDEIVDKLTDEFKYENLMGVPKLKKIVINVGYGDAINDAKTLDVIAENVGLITGQKPVKTKAKSSVANFKLREGQEIGCKVTLRGKIMFEFMDRLINLALPRTRDFQGIPNKSFDGRGNYTMGIKEHTIFPEIDVDKASTVHGMDITFVTSANTDEEAFSMLKYFGMPFKK